ncbi:hypothetical protein DVA86_20905 [Streptomyces armeniacus]|uniref:Htaa domain-containing protein n=1 Tax=Streptomyces armeniacus TaxID=83291 RepID=A0A345XSX8_9ACTN|nr:hypothetical protein [Streptomyces armeniacus]AXK34744.1 hypothetical protein DVA86_20905 [Streptomyces armeniacus]
MPKLSRRARTAAVSAALAAGLVTSLAVGLPAATAGPSDGAPETAAQHEGKQEQRQEQKYVFTDLTAGTDSVDYDNDEVTVSGRLFEKGPDGSPGAPAANESVDVVQAWENPYRGNEGDTTVYSPLGEAKTDAQGNFTLENAKVEERDRKEFKPVPGDFDVRLQAGHRVNPDGMADPSNWDGTGSWSTIKGHPSEARLNTAFKPGEPTPDGRKVTVEGTMERRTADGWAPLPGQLVSLGFQPDEGDDIDSETLTTGEKGEYSGTVTASSNGTVSAGATSWYDGAFLDMPDSRNSTPVEVP